MPKWNISLRDNLKINNHKKWGGGEKKAVERTALPFPVDFKRPSNKQVIFCSTRGIDHSKSSVPESTLE